MATGLKNSKIQNLKPVYQANFTEAYKRLNKQQKLAVDTIDGPVLVNAGPGTGKTQILTLRIANIMQKTDVGAGAILAITFTESGVREMRKRLLSIIGPDAHKVHINTFHGFCNGLISEYPEYFPEIIGAANARDVDSILIIENILDELRPEILRPRGDKYFYVYSILSAIGELKREGFKPDDFVNLLNKVEAEFLARPDLYHEKGTHSGKMKGEHKDTLRLIEKNKELAQIYTQYQDKMLADRMYDFSDMILYVSDALKNVEDFRQTVQERYQYVLVDEHQDTNQAQNKIIDLLAGLFDESIINSPNIFVVGDDKQGIYRFQGASVLNFTEFVRKYPETVVINLVENYRSEAQVLAYAERLLSGHEPLRSQSQNNNTPKISVYECDRPVDEIYAVAEKIKSLISAGAQSKDIAVLYRTNKEAVQIENAFSKMGIKNRVFSDKNIYENIIVKKVLKIIEALVNYNDDSYLLSMLHIKEFNLHPHDIIAIIRKANDLKKRSVFSILYEAKLLDELNLVDPEKVVNLSANFKNWVSARDEKNVKSVIEMILRESGILHKIIANNNADEFDALNSFLNDVDQFLVNDKKSTIVSFLDYVYLKERHKIKTKINHTAQSLDAVSLMTAHKSKGLEFEYVFVMHTNAGIWGNRRQIDHLKLVPAVYGLDTVDEGELDERRLFYVAITRAKSGLVLTYAKNNTEGKELLPAEYLESVPDEHLEHFTHNANVAIDLDLINSDAQPPEKVEIDFVNKLVDDQGLSPTALNNYIDCPWKYFYRNLLRLPEPTENHMLYGTAMHAGVEALFVADSLGQNQDALIAGFENSLLKQPLSGVDFSELLE
nr:UvrD-helicase domain-containing protein [Candidatus Paceibacterota bacterium]